MALTTFELLLASGFWVILLAGIALFAFVAIRANRQVRDLEQIVETQRTHIQRLSQGQAGEGADAPVDSDLLEQLQGEIVLLQAARANGEKEIERLQQALADAADATPAEPAPTNNDDLATELASAREQVAEQGAELARLKESTLNASELEQTLLDEQALAKALRQENEILERQLQAVTEAAELGDVATMREMLVNFTEESRELLEAIGALEDENAELRQSLDDTQSSSRGTTGAVVGLKRKLALAEDEIAALQAECAALRKASG